MKDLHLESRPELRKRALHLACAQRACAKTIGIEKGSPTQKREKVGMITRDQIRQIAEAKMKDLNANDVEAAMRMVEGTCRSMGVQYPEN